MIEPINDTDVKEIEDIPESRKDEIAKMSRKELNAHAFLLGQEQVDYEREKRNSSPNWSRRKLYSIKQ